MPSFPIQLKRNGTAAATPSSLLHGEVALNYADGKLFWKDASNVIQSFTFQAYALSSHSHGNITNAGAIGSTANLPVITTTSGVLTTGSFGTTATTFCEGNDSRLSDTRTPTDGSVTTAKLANDAVTYAKLQNVSAADRLLGRSSAGAGDVEEIACTAFGRSLIDDADAAAARSTLSVQPTASPAFTGTFACGDTVNIGTASATNTIVNVGNGATGNRFALIDIIGDTTYTDYGLRIGRDNNGANGQSIIHHRGTGEIAIVAIDAGSVQLGTSSTARLTISSAGVSTFSGSVVINNDGNVVPLTVTNTGTANSFVVNDASGDTSPFVIDASGAVLTGGALTVRANSGSASHLFTYNENGGEIILYDEAQVSATLFDQISTDTRLLELVNGSNLKLGLGGGNTTGSIQFMRAGYQESVVINSSGQLLVTTGSASACGVAFSGDVNTGLAQLGGADTASLVTAGVERVRVGSNGRVQLFANSEKFGVQLNNGSTGNGPFIGSDGADIFTISTSGGAERVRVDASGNVGIGLSPTERFHVGRSSTGIAGRFTDNATQTLDIGITASAGVYLDNPNSGYVDVRIGGASKFKVGGDGALTAPDVYEDTVGATNRDLFIDSVGKLGYVSSIRASKTNIAAIDDVSWLRNLTPVSFHYRKRNEDGTYSNEPDGTLDYGLIAEDVEPVAPEMCFYDVVDGEPQLRGVHYSKLITPMLRYIQQLEQRIAALEERLNHA